MAHCSKSRPGQAAAHTCYERGSLETYRPNDHSCARRSLLAKWERPAHSDLLGGRGHNDLWQRQSESSRGLGRTEVSPRRSLDVFERSGSLPAHVSSSRTTFPFASQLHHKPFVGPSEDGFTLPVLISEHSTAMTESIGLGGVTEAASSSGLYE